MLKEFQYIYNGAKLVRVTGASESIGRIEAIAGTIKTIAVQSPNVGAVGNFVFNVRKNNTPLLSSADRLTVNTGAKRAEKTDADFGAITTVKGDLLSFALDEVGAGGILGDLIFTITIDDGIEAETDIAADIHAAAAKTTPVNDDEFALVDSAASNVLKKLSWQNLKATLKAYFDTFYQPVLTSGTNLKTINSQSLLGSGDITISGGLGEANTASNVGVTGAGVFKQKSGVDLQFRKIKAGSNISITQNADDIEISASGSGGGGAANSSVYSLDEKPFEDVHPLSDFFDGAASWATFQSNYFKHTIESGCLKLIANPVSGDALCGLMKDLPDGNCTIIAKIDASYVAGGMALALFQDGAANPNTSDIIYFGLFNASGTVYLVPTRFADFQTFGANIYSNVDLNSATEVTGAVYVKMSRTDANWSFSYSINGRKETSLGSAFTESSYFAPKQFGIITDNPNSLSGNLTQITRCQFVYFFDRDNANLVGGRIGDGRVSAVENRVICVGDSITEGAGVSELKTYPHKLAETLDAVSLSVGGQVLTADDEARSWKVLNKGYSGYTTQKIIDKIIPNVLLRRDSNLTRDIVVLFAGTNDANFGTPAATVYANLTSMIGTLQTAGFEVFVCTLIDRNDLGGGFDTFRASLNTTITTNAAGADGVIDLWSDARLQNAGDTTYFQSDTVHPTAAGLAVIAEIVEAAL